MNIFRSLIGKVWHDPNAAEVVKISEGQLFLVRSESVRGGRECLYNDAMATIRRVSSMDHAFQLVITRVFEDGDQELLEDEDETDEERVFLICDELEFRTGTTADDEPTFIWRDLQGDDDEVFEFVASGTNAPTRAFFETCMYRAMYETKYRASADNTTDADLQQFIWQPPAAKKSKTKTSRKASGSAPVQEPIEDAPEETTEAPLEATISVATSTDDPLRALIPDTDPNMPSIFSEVAELNLWDSDKQTFDKQDNVVVRIVHNRSNGPYDYWLTAKAVDGKGIQHRISSDMNQRWAPRVLSFTWNHIEDNGYGNSWCLRFESDELFRQFTHAITRAFWESANQLPWAKAKTVEQDYIISANTEDVEMQDVEDDSDDEDTVANELDQSEDEEEEVEYYSDDGETEEVKMLQGRNKQLVVGYKGDRSYVVRGDKIGTFRHPGNNQVKYAGTLGKINDSKGKAFSPKHVMLHDQDTKMILMNPGERHALYELDIETGKIVEEWKVHEDIAVDHIAPDNKFAQMTPEQTVVGISHNALFRIDPRVSGNKMVDSQYKQYVSKNKFSGVATTGAGQLAVASEKGDIRLFDSIGKNAKTALPPLGDPITGIDVTADGRWVVATTKTYLLLIDTLIGGGRYTGQLGFERSFPADSKPRPRRLQLRAEHVAFMGKQVSFTPARFNMGEGQAENAIVTSTGRYVVAWDFAKVKKDQLDKYEIKWYEDDVVQDNFKFGDDKEIIVALPDDVLSLSKKNLKRPTRASLAPRSSLSRSSIVNSPY